MPNRPNRYVALAGRTKHPARLIYGWLLGFVGLAVTRLAVPQMGWILTPITIVFAVGGGLAVLIFLMTPRRVALEVGFGGLIVDGGRGGTFPRDGMTVGVWRLPMYGVPSGAVLCFEAGGRRFSVGGRDVRPPNAAPAIDRVDAYVELAAFEALVDQLAVPRWPTSARCLLALNRVAMRPGPPLLAIELGDVVRVIELATSHVVGSAPVSAVVVHRGVHVATGRMTFRFLVISLTVSGMAPLTITTPDLRFTWRGDQARVSAASYVCGAPDWLLLVRTFGLESSHQIAATP